MIRRWWILLSTMGWCDVCYSFTGHLHHMYNEERWCAKCLSMCQD